METTNQPENAIDDIISSDDEKHKNIIQISIDTAEGNIINPIVPGDIFISAGSLTNTEVPVLNIASIEPPNEQETAPPSIMSTFRQFSEEELDSALQTLLKTNELPQLEIRKPLLQHISRRKVDAITQSDYELGEKLCKAEVIIRTGLAQSLQDGDKQSEAHSVQLHLKLAKEDLESARQEWDEKLKAIEARQQADYDILMQTQAEDEQTFQEFWKDPSSFHNFNKPSAQLLQLRGMEKRLAIGGEFAEAKKIKKRADKLQEVETVAAQKKALDGMHVAYDAMKAKHVQAEAAHERLYHQRKLQLETRRIEALRPLEMTVKKLERQKANPRTPRKVPIVSRGRIKKSPAPDDIDDQPPVTTPRTAQRLNRIRDKSNPQTLHVKGIEVSKYIKPRSRPASNLDPIRKKKKDDF